MTSYYFAKVDISILDERRVASLPDSSWRRYIECILLAKEFNADGFLPSVADMAWRLRITEDTLAADLSRLALAGLAELRSTDGGERWFMTTFADSQAAASGAERVRRHRESGRTKVSVTPSNADRNDAVTIRYTEEKRKEKRGEGEQIARETQLQPEKDSPPPLVKNQSSDKTPEGFQKTQGYKPPAEPPGNRHEPSAEVVAVGELANAITEVTGISAKLNWSDKSGGGVGDLAKALHQAGYTADQVRAHYGRNKIAERWNWYESDWRGKKGDKPRLKEIRETIAGAVVDQPGKPQQESGQSWLEQSLRLARANGLLPQK